MSDDPDAKARVRRVDLDDVTLIWGDKAGAKAELRSEALARHLALPLGDRLLRALELVTRGTPA